MFLLFRKEFHEAIRSGAKRQTIRFWKQRPVRPGGHLRLEWADRWSVEVDGTRATINGKRIEMEPGVTWLFDGETGTATPCEPGRADSWVV